jgi:hypothetical protein
MGEQTPPTIISPAELAARIAQAKEAARLAAMTDDERLEFAERDAKIAEATRQGDALANLIMAEVARDRIYWAFLHEQDEPIRANEYLYHTELRAREVLQQHGWNYVRFKHIGRWRRWYWMREEPDAEARRQERGDLCLIAMLHPPGL